MSKKVRTPMEEDQFDAIIKPLVMAFGLALAKGDAGIVLEPLTEGVSLQYGFTIRLTKVQPDAQSGPQGS